MNPYTATIQPPMATPDGVADTEVPILQQIANGGGSGLGSGVVVAGGAPLTYDFQSYTYVAGGAADNDDIATITYRNGGASGTIVAVTTMSYYGSTNNLKAVTTTRV